MGEIALAMADLVGLLFDLLGFAIEAVVGACVDASKSTSGESK
jgi:hypothetical protein